MSMNHYEIVENRVSELTQGPGQVVVATAPSDGERAQLQEAFQLDDFDFASTLDQDEVPRLDSSNGRLLLIWKVPEFASATAPVELGVNVVGISLLNDRALFIRATGDIPLAEREFRSVRDPRDVTLALLLRTVRHFVAHLKVIRQIRGELEKKVTVSMENKHLLQMFSLSESLIYYLDALEGNAAVLSRLRAIGGLHGFEARHLEMLDDIILENAQAARQANIFSSVLSGLMDARGTIVNNNMNVLLKNLTLINIVFLPLNLIASIGGMSEWSMMTSGLDWRLSYALFSVAMVLVGWVTWLFMKKVIDRGAVKAHDPN
jgi:magnesium transporter